jgi:hypothetical protein
MVKHSAQNLGAVDPEKPSGPYVQDTGTMYPQLSGRLSLPNVRALAPSPILSMVEDGLMLDTSFWHPRRNQKIGERSSAQGILLLAVVPGVDESGSDHESDGLAYHQLKEWLNISEC